MVANEPAFVPEAIIVYVLKHSSAFDWLCINCSCCAEPVGGACATPGGKWQRAQGETGLDVVARLSTPRHQWFAGLDSHSTMVILEAKGDRTSRRGAMINRPAYNEMTGGLAAFFLSNLARIRDHPERTYGWLVPTTFYEHQIEDFTESRRNLAVALPPGRAFLLGTFDGQRFWREAAASLQEAASEWFRVEEGVRNRLLRERLGHTRPETRGLAEALFRFELVRASSR